VEDANFDLAWGSLLLAITRKVSEVKEVEHKCKAHLQILAPWRGSGKADGRSNGSAERSHGYFIGDY